MKELLMNLNQMGKTIIISSHILSELSEMCNSIGIMNHGRLITAGRMEDITMQLGNGNKIHVSVKGNMDVAVRTVQEFAGVQIQSVMEHELTIVCNCSDEEISGMIGQMIYNGAVLSGFNREEGNLESLFMQLTGGEENA